MNERNRRRGAPPVILHSAENDRFSLVTTAAQQTLTCVSRCSGKVPLSSLTLYDHSISISPDCKQTHSLASSLQSPVSSTASQQPKYPSYLPYHDVRHRSRRSGHGRTAPFNPSRPCSAARSQEGRSRQAYHQQDSVGHELSLSCNQKKFSHRG